MNEDSQVNGEPRKYLLRRHEVCEWTGISDFMLQKMLAAGVIHAKPIIPGGRLFFYRDEIKRTVLTEPNQKGN